MIAGPPARALMNKTDPPGRINTSVKPARPRGGSARNVRQPAILGLPVGVHSGPNKGCPFDINTQFPTRFLGPFITPFSRVIAGCIWLLMIAMRRETVLYGLICILNAKI